MNKITIYSSGCRGNKRNCLYPEKHVVTSADELKEAVTHDNVCALYKGGYRSSSNFISSDCLPFDCDNDHSDDPADWKEPIDVAKAFTGVPFYVIYSRNHNKWKKGKSPRPRFHVYFPISEVSNMDDYKALKDSVIQFFPYFDSGAKDAARFFFGIEEPVIEVYGGDA